ncbi:hypothetical protein [Companilactobacillus zhachilii]|uniref:hypothetical protein n=1 Tax=Companilactobacillus zhachilii TaxID=2304606 RepID=UPI00403456EB
MRRHKGFVLIESLTALFISLLILWTLVYCVNEQFTLLNNWEEKVSSDKIILLHLKSDKIPNPIIIKDKKYYFSQDLNFYQVKVNGHAYKIKK